MADATGLPKIAFVTSVNYFCAHMKDAKLPIDLVWQKVADRQYDDVEFINILSERVDILLNDSQLHQDFVNEMKRFLPPEIVRDTVLKNDFWTYLCALIQEEVSLVIARRQGTGSGNEFKM